MGKQALAGCRRAPDKNNNAMEYIEYILQHQTYLGSITQGKEGS